MINIENDSRFRKLQPTRERTSVARLSNVETDASRKGMLGCFPPPPDFTKNQDESPRNEKRNSV